MFKAAGRTRRDARRHTDTIRPSLQKT